MDGQNPADAKPSQELSRDESGKIRTVVSKIAPNLQYKTDNQCMETVTWGRL